MISRFEMKQKFAAAVKALARLSNILAIIIIPIVVTVWTAAFDPAKEPMAFWGGIIPLAVIQTIFFWATNKYSETLPEMYLNNEDLKSEIETSQEIIAYQDSEIDWLEKATDLGLYWSTFQGLIEPAQLSTHENLGLSCQMAIRPMLDVAGTLFGFEYGETWSAAVYKLNQDNNMLQPVWYERAEDHPSTGTPRYWTPGDGHVGAAFMQQRILYTTDANSQQGSLLKPNASNQKPYDRTVYSSFVCAPISLDLNDEVLRFGVLVITSNIAGRFNEHNQDVVLHAAQVLAHLFFARRVAETAPASYVRSDDGRNGDANNG